MEKQAINTGKSTVKWIGKKISGAHSGKISLKDGGLDFEDNKLTGGRFTMDMTTIGVEDVEGKTKEKFEGHLKSEDFFDVENYPTSKLTIKQIAKKPGGYGIAADLKIKDTIKTVTFDLTVDEKEKLAEADLVIDRTQYDIKFGSGNFFDDLGEALIYDDFQLNVKLSY